MTFYLRDSQNKNIVECEITIILGLINITTTIDIVAYSHLLINRILQALDVIEAFRQIEDFRRWYFEIHRHRKDKKERPVEEYQILIAEAKKMFHAIANELNLEIVED